MTLAILLLGVVNAGLGVALLLFFRHAETTVVRDVARDLADHEARCISRYKETTQNVEAIANAFHTRLCDLETVRKRELNG